jgi:hypothetical protein
MGNPKVANARFGKKVSDETVNNLTIYLKKIR